VTPATFDSALRYDRALTLLSSRYRPELSLVELGSGAAGLAEFVDHRVTGVDAAFDRTAERTSAWLIPVEGHATEVPLPDHVFDVVLSLDMIEHLSPSDRRKALAEMLRLLAPGGRMIVGCPAGAAARAMDRRLQGVFSALHGRPHPWVSEHIEHGLPDPVQLREELASLTGPGTRVQVFGNVWRPVWYGVHAVYTVGGARLPLRAFGLHTARGARLLFRVVRRLNRAPYYRTMFVVDAPARADPIAPTP
jgi:SAM-dependent methyltransferase